MNIKSILLRATKQLNTHSDSPSLDAELLLMHVLQKPRSYLYAWPEQMLTAEQQSVFLALLDRRCHGEPVAYITGRKEFWSLPLKVTSDTLVPRPETELLVELVLSLAPGKQPLDVADLGTGSGAIAVAIAHERPNWQVIAIDQSEKALAVAKENVSTLHLSNVTLLLGDWLEPLVGKQFDIIVSNPPYISNSEWQDVQHGLQYEPQSALIADNDGLADIEKIIASAVDFLKRDGLLLIEHGFAQADKVQAIFVSNGYSDVKTVCDFAGIARVTQGCLKTNCKQTLGSS